MTQVIRMILTVPEERVGGLIKIFSAADIPFAIDVQTLVDGRSRIKQDPTPRRAETETTIKSRVIGALVHRGPLNVSELASLTALPNKHVSDALFQLKRAKLVKRGAGGKWRASK